MLLPSVLAFLWLLLPLSLDEDGEFPSVHLFVFGYFLGYVYLFNQASPVISAKIRKMGTAARCEISGPLGLEFGLTKDPPHRPAHAPSRRVVS